MCVLCHVSKLCSLTDWLFFCEYYTPLQTITVGCARTTSWFPSNLIKGKVFLFSWNYGTFSGRYQGKLREFLVHQVLGTLLITLQSMYIIKDCVMQFLQQRFVTIWSGNRRRWTCTIMFPPWPYPRRQLIGVSSTGNHGDRLLFKPFHMSTVQFAAL